MRVLETKAIHTLMELWFPLCRSTPRWHILELKMAVHSMGRNGKKSSLCD